MKITLPRKRIYPGKIVSKEKVYEKRGIKRASDLARISLHIKPTLIQTRINSQNDACRVSFSAEREIRVMPRSKYCVYTQVPGVTLFHQLERCSIPSSSISA